MITITAFKWVPPFAQGQVRDHRLRWMLKEVGWDYRVELIDPKVQASEAYRCEQPFGQVPVLREDGRPPLFETGAIVLDVAKRSGKLLPQSEAERALATSWLFAALNSVEPFLAEIAIADIFIEDKKVAEGYRPFAEKLARQRLQQLSASLGDKIWLVSDAFTVADLMMSSVTKVVHHTDLVDAHDNLAAWRDRCFARPAYKAAIAEQLADFEGNGPLDMGWDKSLAKAK
jgi:glutathione S-transferase